MKIKFILIPFLTTCVACAALPTQTDSPQCKQMDFSFTLRNEQHFLSELRSRPVVLVLMRTSELSSQAYMQQVREAFTSVAGTTRFLVLTVEPSEAPFVEAYTEFEELPFRIGVAGPEVQSGNTSFGAIPDIPCTYIIDQNGCVFDGATGVVKADMIVETVKALQRS